MKQTNGKYPKRGDIYWVSFDPSQGTEIQKTRPAVVLSNNMFNKNLNRVIIAPITSNTKHIFDFDCEVVLLGKKGKIMLDQLRAVDKSRLKKIIGILDPKVLKNLEEALKITFDIY